MNEELMYEDDLEDLEDFEVEGEDLEDLEDFEDLDSLSEDGEETIDLEIDDFEDAEDYDSEDAEEMELLGELAATTDSDTEADAFLGALVPLAAKLLPKVGGLVLPHLVRGVAGLGRRMRRSRRGRRFVRALPSLARASLRTLVRRMSRGLPVTGPVAARILSRHAAALLRNRRALHRCMRRNRMLARRARSVRRGRRRFR